MTLSSIIWFEQLGLADVGLVGGKNASLGELTSSMTGISVQVPDGFATTASAFRAFLSENELSPAIGAWIERYRSGDTNLRRTGKAIRKLILGAQLSTAFVQELEDAYALLGERTGVGNVPVAVRSSATAEDLPGASFAGQHETFLNVSGARDVASACLRCFASLYTDRAISYREAKSFDHSTVALSVGVQQMVRADLASSGVMFSIDTETGFENVVSISAAWGLGETVVQGTVDPDHYQVFKPLLKSAKFKPIILKELGKKAIKTIYSDKANRPTKIVKTTKDERATFALSEGEVLELARWAVAIEQHYGLPMDIEWAKDGMNERLYLVQARPETVHARQAQTVFRHYSLKTDAKPLVIGAAVGNAIAVGKAYVIHSPDEIESFPDNAILVTGATDPDWVPLMKRAAGIITDHGSTTSHAAIVSRELGVPAVVGTGNATSVLQTGDVLTLSCASDNKGKIFKGKLAYTSEEIDLAGLPKTSTQLMLNIADPATAIHWWRLPAAGVGLARMEFIINNHINAHPMALLYPERITPVERRRIALLAVGHDSFAEYFVDHLARGIGRLASPFFPNPVIVRLSDFKTNEYAHLTGGGSFEPAEENPMLGFRGASRYYDARYRNGFGLECAALRRVREELGFTNIIVMIPFCRTVAEADRVLEVMAANGLSRGADGLQIYMMCEIPSNVILAEQFATRFDGFSIGSNDLTQLILGVDRDSEILSGLFDERDEAVLAFIAEAIKKAHKAGIKIGLCGQAPSNHPEFAKFLVGQGIDSISLNPDSFVRGAEVVAEAEKSKRH